MEKRDDVIRVYLKDFDNCFAFDVSVDSEYGSLCYLLIQKDKHIQINRITDIVTFLNEFDIVFSAVSKEELDYFESLINTWLKQSNHEQFVMNNSFEKLIPEDINNLNNYIGNELKIKTK